MTEEIKEILFLLHNDRLADNGKRKLEYYITNLQQELEKANDTLDTHNELIEKLYQENERLKEENILLKASEPMSKIAEDYGYKSRCEKAIEYIMTNLITEWDIENDGYVSGSDLPVDAIMPILNVLDGSYK